MPNQNRTRPHSFLVYCNVDELIAIDEKMTQAGITNRQRYARKMMLDGHITNLNEPLGELRNMAFYVSTATNNINQIAKRANETRTVRSHDVEALQAEVRKLTQTIYETRELVKTVADQQVLDTAIKLLEAKNGEQNQTIQTVNPTQEVPDGNHPHHESPCRP